MSQLFFRVVLVVAGFCGACTPTGRVQVFVQAEESIPEGIEPGMGDENIVDGWRVTYDKFLVALGDFRASRSANPQDELAFNGVHVLDLVQLPTGGAVIAEFDDVLAARWDEVGFSLRNATAASVQGEGVSASDYALMTNNGYTLWIEGQINKPGGQQCLPSNPADCAARSTVTFAWGLRVPTVFAGCASEGGEPGFAVPSGGVAQVEPTIHGDHWFFTHITQGEEIATRRAQWVADVDVNRDGVAALSELAATPAAQLLTSTLGYNLTGSLLPSIQTVRDYLEAQARTLIDYQGDGECEDRTILSD
ncbi:MAG: hypothetical protein ACKVPX_16730 [Myxococcaceae bacterium]